MRERGSSITSGNANQGSFMNVLLTGNYDLLIRLQATLDLDLIAGQIAQLNAASEDPLPGSVVYIDRRQAAKISNYSRGGNRKHVDHHGVVDARLADHAGAQNMLGIGHGDLGRKGARNRIRQKTYRLDFALETLIVERGYGDQGPSSFVNFADLCFGDADPHLHRIEI